ncbi:MAG: sialate O-acetylesterase, partial [Lentisphaerae bacterium]
MLRSSFCGLVVLMSLMASLGVWAEVRLPAIFSNYMVLQRNARVKIWGWAKAGEKITINASWQKQATAVAGDQGQWMAELETPAGGGPYQVEIKGETNSVVLDDVLIGEVWLCSGQSNMAFTVRGAKNAAEEIQKAYYPQIRHFAVARHPARSPQEDCKGTWTVCSPKTVSGYTAVGYFFARELYEKLKIPVGLIHSSWGGTPIRSWTPLEAQQDDPVIKEIKKKMDEAGAKYDEQKAKTRYEQLLKQWKEKVKIAREKKQKLPRRPRPPMNPLLSQRYPGNLFNGMIAPLVPYTIRGALWYQGEANAHSLSDAWHYRVQLERLIKSWRNVWSKKAQRQEDFYFYAVQLPNFRALQTHPVEEEDTWPVLRESIQVATTKVPRAGMVVTIDVGEAKNIHPKDKQTVGYRLACRALAEVYGRQGEYFGPLFRQAKIEGDKVILDFDHTGRGLVFRGDATKAFAIAGNDRKFVWAEAKIDGQRIIVHSPQVKEPAAVRYAWANNPAGAVLYNQ